MKLFVVFNLLILLILVVGKIYTCNKNQIKFDFMNCVHTDMIKGISILSVIWAHCGARMGVPMLQFVAGIGVSLFLLCSGYGLQCSYKRNGLHFFWRKRLLKVLVPCWLIYFVELLVKQDNFSRHSFWKLLFLEDVNWFIYYILSCYIIFWCICKVTKSNTHVMLFCLFIVFGVWFVIESFFPGNLSIPFLRARQMLSFPLGVLLADKKELVKQCLISLCTINKWRGGLFIISCYILGCVGQLITQLRIMENVPCILTNSLYLLVNILLTIGTFLLIERWHNLLLNEVLVKMGRLSLEFFLLHFYVLSRINRISDIIIYGAVLVVAVLLLNRVSNYFMKIGMGKSE